MMVQSDLPLFDDVKKGESYLMRETYFVYLTYILCFVLCIILCLDMYLVWTCTCLCYLCFVVICHV